MSRQSPPRVADLLTRLERKQRAVEQVAAGRLSLSAAAAHFGGPDDGGDLEARCRAVIGWVRLALCDSPERADAAERRLESELDAALRPTPRRV